MSSTAGWIRGTICLLHKHLQPCLQADASLLDFRCNLLGRIPLANQDVKTPSQLLTFIRLFANTIQNRCLSTAPVGKMLKSQTKSDIRTFFLAHWNEHRSSRIAHVVSCITMHALSCIVHFKSPDQRFKLIVDLTMRSG